MVVEYRDGTPFTGDNHTHTELANAIRTKKYGKDVREPIAQLADKMGDVIEKIPKLNAGQALKGFSPSFTSPLWDWENMTVTIPAINWSNASYTTLVIDTQILDISSVTEGWISLDIKNKCYVVNSISDTTIVVGSYSLTKKRGFFYNVGFENNSTTVATLPMFGYTTDLIMPDWDNDLIQIPAITWGGGNKSIKTDATNVDLANLDFGFLAIKRTDYNSYVISATRDISDDKIVIGAFDKGLRNFKINAFTWDSGINFKNRQIRGYSYFDKIYCDWDNDKIFIPSISWDGLHSSRYSPYTTSEATTIDMTTDQIWFLTLDWKFIDGNERFIFKTQSKAPEDQFVIGWGDRRSRTASFTAISSSLDAQTKINLVMFVGQSNMAGRGDNLNQVEANVEQAGYEFRAISDPTRLYRVTEPFGVNENNPYGINEPGAKTGGIIRSFINEAYRLTGQKIIGVSASKGGSSIEEWQPGGPYLTDAINRMNLAKKYMEKQGIPINATYMIFLQGETDGDRGMSKESYTEKLEKMIYEMEKAGVNHTFLIRIGEGPADYTKIQEAQTEYCKTRKNVTLISTVLKRFKSLGFMKDSYHYHQFAYNFLAHDAAKNYAYYINTNKEPTMYDSLTGGLYIPLDPKF